MKTNYSFNRKNTVSIVTMLTVLTLMLGGCNNSGLSAQNTTGINSTDNPITDISGIEDADKNADIKSEESANISSNNADRKSETNELELNVSFSGGSGKTTVKSPTKATVSGDFLLVQIEWSSPNYDYMIVDGEKYLPVNDSGNSVFEIPIDSAETEITVIADTVAMSKPHEIEYVLSFSEANDSENKIIPETENAQTENAQTVINGLSDKDKEEIKSWYSKHKVTDELKLIYAQKYKVQTIDNTYLTAIINNNDYYIITEDNNIPDDLPECFTVINKPLDNIYIVSSASIDYFLCLDALDCVSFTSVKEGDANNQKLSTLMKEGTIKYAGKYSAPDYELLLSKGCSLAVENTMIGHSADVLEQLHKVKINTMIDYSSHEASPFGRMEWIKLYGILTGKEKLANEIFEAKEKSLSGGYDNTGKTVAYFYITNSGGVVIRKNQDYISELINMAGGDYIFTKDSTYDGTGTMTIQKEAFFEAVLDCDYLIYNSTIAGELKDKSELLSKCEVLKNTKAFKEDHIFSTTDNIYLSVMELPQIAEDINNALNGKETSQFLYKLN